MQPFWPHLLAQLIDRRPSIGRLVDLCEENYRQLHRLAPGLRELHGERVACRPGHADLHLEILGHTRYTTEVRLTYWFEAEQGALPEPDARLRVYHDARQLEVLELRQSLIPTERLYEAPGLLNKWQANWFLSKWLGFCVRLGYRFPSSAPHPGAARRALPAAS